MGISCGLVPVVLACSDLALRADAENFQEVRHLRIAQLAGDPLQPIGHAQVEGLRRMAYPTHDMMMMSSPVLIS
ncbi:MAG: hypothetical protein WDN28_00135 [Chthoniobacter sp.]